ncbi:hypothetical protein SprV_0200847800 [Sparganum proliferum]
MRGPDILRRNQVCLHGRQQSAAVRLIDFVAAFDYNHRECPWRIMELDGMPGEIIAMDEACHRSNNAQVMIHNNLNQLVDIRSGVRPIVALKGSPTYNLAKWMYSKLKFLQGNSTTSVRSASQFLIDLRGRRIQADEIMVSLDVTSLFTPIPPNLAREVLRKRLEEAYDETQNALKIEHLMRLFEFCQQTFFTFAGETYEQIKGTPMGSPVSDLVAELVLQELEKMARQRPDAQSIHVHVDVVGPLPPSNGYTHLLTCVDRYTPWAEAIPLPSAQAETIVKAFVSRWVAISGAPSTVTTDRGAQFESALFQTLLNFLGCTRIRTTAYHPAANGVVERFHRQLKTSLRAAEDPGS